MDEQNSRPPSRPISEAEAAAARSLENCVVVCRACHLNAHEGGRWDGKELYADVGYIGHLPEDEQLEKIGRIAALYTHYRG